MIVTEYVNKDVNACRLVQYIDMVVPELQLIECAL